jgi:hypothetical protein
MISSILTSITVTCVNCLGHSLWLHRINNDFINFNFHNSYLFLWHSLWPHRINNVFIHSNFHNSNLCFEHSLWPHWINNIFIHFNFNNSYLCQWYSLWPHRINDFIIITGVYIYKMYIFRLVLYLDWKFKWWWINIDENIMYSMWSKKMS